MTHDWGSNIVTIQGNGIIKIITIIKNLRSKVRRPKVLLCYNYQNGIINLGKKIIFATKPKLFSIGIINFPKTIQSVKSTAVEIMDTSGKTSTLELNFGVHSIKKRQLARHMNQK
jgi:hypothetical protein